MKIREPFLLAVTAFLLLGTPEAFAAEKGTGSTAGISQLPAAEATVGPGAPTSLALSIIPSSFLLTWTLSPQDPGSVTGYEISRAVVFTGPYEVVGRVSQGVDRFEDTTAPPENICYYKVRAMEGDKYSPFSNEAAGELPAPAGN